MGYKTVAVHLNHEARAHRLLGVGIELARRHDAHLIGLHVIPSLRFAPAMHELSDRMRYVLVVPCGALALQQVLYGRASEFLYFQF